jgi:malonate-semialdehyde dehydrogenase (acetylating)/methylmalonate-semialdehyde dehydrogenase
MLKGEFTESAGPGIDMYSMRQPLGVVAGITPFNFPAMIPMWKFCPAIACRQRLHPQAVRARSVGADAAGRTDDRGRPAGWRSSMSSMATRNRSTRSLTIRNNQAIGFVGSTPIAEYVYSRGCANGKRVQCFGGAKNHMIIMPDADMDQAVDALIGAGYGSAGERCMAISVAVPVGEDTADRLMRSLRRGSKPQDRAFDRWRCVDYGPLVTKEARNRSARTINSGVDEGREAGGRWPRLQDAGL